jgi:hypothetical protein
MDNVPLFNSLRFQSGILEKGRHAKYLPYAFTEQGVALLSSVLNRTQWYWRSQFVTSKGEKIEGVEGAHGSINPDGGY